MEGDTIVGDLDHLAVLDLAHELGADDVEGAGFRGEHIGALELAEHQRTDAERIARGEHAVGGERHEGIAAFDLANGVDEALDRARLRAAGDEVENDLGIGRRMADGAL